MTPTPTLSRRDLLRGAAIAAFPAIVPARVLGALAPSNRINLAHIGTGNRGSDLMNGFLGIPECRVVAACDCFRSRRDAAAQRVGQAYGETPCRTYANFRELCAAPDIDAVVVATPDHWHVRAALEAVRNSKHVYVEKPLGYSIEQDLALRSAVRRYGVVFQYGTQQRSQPHMRWVCEMVLNGRIGTLRAVEVECPGGIGGGSTEPAPIPDGLDYDMYLGPAPWSPYTIDRCTPNGSYHISDFALGYIGGWGAHPLDIMSWGLGDGPDVVPVELEGSGYFPPAGLFDTSIVWDVQGKFADGKRFRFRGGPWGDKTTFIGDRGRIETSRSGIALLQPEKLRLEKLSPGERRLTVSDNHGADFINCCKTGRRTVAPVEAACRSDLVTQLSEIAIRTGRKVRWDTVAERIIGDESAARMAHRPMRAPWSLG